MTSIAVWDEVHRTRQWGTCPEPAVARWAMRRWTSEQRRDALGKVRLLEVGCGVGTQAFWLANNGFIVDAVDASYHAVDRAEQLHGRFLPHSLHFYVLDIGRLDTYPSRLTLEPGSYDGLIDAACLQHVERLDGAIKTCAAMLKPGGAMLSIFASEKHSPVGAGTELEGATFHRLTSLEVFDIFPASLFREVHLEQSMHTDRGRCIAHWIVEAVK